MSSNFKTSDENIFDIISTNKLDALVSPLGSIDESTTIREKRSILKSDGYAGLFQFSEEYNIDANDEQKQFEFLKEREKVLQKRRYSLLDSPDKNISSLADCRKSLCSSQNYTLECTITPPKKFEEFSANHSMQIKDCQNDCDNHLRNNEKPQNNIGDNFYQVLTNDEAKTINGLYTSCDSPLTMSGFSPPIVLHDDQNSPTNEEYNNHYSEYCKQKFFGCSTNNYDLKSNFKYQAQRKSCFNGSSTSTENSNKECNSSNKSTRRASVTFGAVEELQDNIIRTLCIPSIEEDVNSEAAELDDFAQPGNSNFGKDQEELDIVEQIRQTKQRSRSLCPAPAELTSEKILSLKITSNNRYNNYRSRDFSNNLRSDSIDSGFSCASISSCSSSDSSIPLDQRVRTRSSSVACQMSKSPYQSDSADFSIWLKSVKRLVQLTKELKNDTLANDTQKVNLILDEISNSRVDVENVKKFVRHNDWPVSHEIRADLWRLLCHNKDFDSNKQLYTRQLDDLTKSGVKTFRPLFLSMDGMVVDDHGLRQEGAITLQRLLIVIECVRPEIRYVPSINHFQIAPRGREFNGEFNESKLINISLILSMLYIFIRGF